MCIARLPLLTLLVFLRLALRLQKTSGSLADYFHILRDDELCLSYFLVKTNWETLPPFEEACNAEQKSGPGAEELKNFVDLSFMSSGLCRSR